MPRKGVLGLSQPSYCMDKGGRNLKTPWFTRIRSDIGNIALSSIMDIVMDRGFQEPSIRLELGPTIGSPRCRLLSNPHCLQPSSAPATHERLPCQALSPPRRISLATSQ